MAKKVKSIPTPILDGPMDAETLGKFVKARRTQSKLRLEDAALLCGVAKDTLLKIENAKGTVMLESVLQVCKMLGIRLQVAPWEEE